MTHRIVQLTDCHLFADPERSLRGIVTWPRLAAALDSVRRHVSDAELLVLTGDTAHDEARETYESVRNVLAEWAGRVRVIPGNHDDRYFLRDVFSQGSGGPVGRVTFHVPWHDWQVIGLDSQCPGELPGSLGVEQLDWLRTQLKAPLHTLLLLHHPPIAVQSPWLDKIGLQDASDFERLLQDHPQVRLVVCGHVHQEVAGALGRATVFTTPAVGPQFRPRTEQLVIDPLPPAFRVLELHSDGRWSTQVLQCD
jgi:3',5'-cyclic-AMP phosphodiesterase